VTLNDLQRRNDRLSRAISAIAEQLVFVPYINCLIYFLQCRRFC